MVRLNEGIGKLMSKVIVDHFGGSFSRSYFSFKKCRFGFET
jgi:hypothetical protein